jgi:hypothetical protein
MECLQRTCYTACAAQPCVSDPLPGAGEGIRTPDPLITNQMLYQLSYASSLGPAALCGQATPSDPFLMSGTILKATITALYVQPQGEQEEHVLVLAFSPRPPRKCSLRLRALAFCRRGQEILNRRVISSPTDPPRHSPSCTKAGNSAASAPSGPHPGNTASLTAHPAAAMS